MPSDGRGDSPPDTTLSSIFEFNDTNRSSGLGEDTWGPGSNSGDGNYPERPLADNACEGCCGRSRSTRLCCKYTL